MSFADFHKSAQSGTTPPPELSRALASLWHDQRGQWDIAHDLAQEAGGKEGAWVHAYLHRKEGDASNAGYWYRLAGQPVCGSTLSVEWQQIAQTLLSRG